MKAKISSNNSMPEIVKLNTFIPEVISDKLMDTIMLIFILYNESEVIYHFLKNIMLALTLILI